MKIDLKRLFKSQKMHGVGKINDRKIGDVSGS